MFCTPKKSVSGLVAGLFLLLILAFSFGLSSEGRAAEEPLAPISVDTVLAEIKSEMPQVWFSNLSKRLQQEPDFGADFLSKLFAAKPRAAASVYVDAAVAELIWTSCAKKKWSESLCELAAKLLDSPDPVAVMFAEWSIAIRVGYENSQNVAVWTEDMPDKPSWYAAWLQFPAERFPEMDYWRVGSSFGVHRSMGGLHGTAVKFMERTEGLYQEILAAPDSDRKRQAIADMDKARADLKTVCDCPDMLKTRQLYSQFRNQTRKVILANPSLDFDQILFTKRYSNHGLRNITGSQYPHSHKPGGDLCVKTGFDPTTPVRGILNGQLGPGHVHGTDLHWNADKIVFGYACQPVWPLKHPTHQNDAHWFFEMRKSTPPLHLYEVNLDGTGLHQITDDPFWGDFEPTYAADGSIVFASDRSGRSSMCGNFSADHTVINLHRCNPDGTGLRMISDNKDIDRYPHALDNGLIGYTRWEYQERHFYETHSFWTIRPDGTYAEAAYKSHISTPYALRDTRSIPNSNKYVSVGTGHHTLAYGQILIFDLLGGPNDKSRLFAVTPNVHPGEGPAVRNAVPQGGVIDQVGRFSGPFPLSETSFLVSFSSHTPGFDGRLGGDQMFSIFLIDVYGNKELIHRERLLSCDFPTPIKKRAVPFNVADGRMSQEKYPHPVCYIEDVSKGLPAEEKGKIKYLRIMQHVGWPLDDQIGAMRWAPGDAGARTFGFWSWAPVREIGIVPVEDDGSAKFYVPANISVYFQALDENKLEVRRMRTHISLENGESRGCIGCHETRAAVVSAAPGRFPKAFARDPSLPKEPIWGSENLISYENHIQPIFDQYCTSCHDGEKLDGGLNLLGTRDPKTNMLTSFSSLFPAWKANDLIARKVANPETGKTETILPLVSVSNKHSNGGITKVREFGSSQSRLILALINDPMHRDEVRAKMKPDDWDALVGWVDANAPYYDTFFNRRPTEGKGPIRNVRKTFPISMHE